jgi:hypothetical protein
MAAFLLAVEMVKKQVPLGTMEEYLRAGDAIGLFQALDLDQRFQEVAEGKGLPPDTTSLLEALQRAFNDGAQAELEALGRVTVMKFNPCHKPAGSSEGGQFCELSELEQQTTLDKISRLMLSGNAQVAFSARERNWLAVTVNNKEYELYRGIGVQRFRVPEQLRPEVDALKVGDPLPDFLKKHAFSTPYASYTGSKTVANTYSEGQVSIVTRAVILPKDILVDLKNYDKLGAVAQHHFKDSRDYILKDKEVFVVEPVSATIIRIKGKIRKSDISKASIGAEMSLNLLNPEAITFLSNYVFNLIRELSKDQRLAIQDILLEAFKYGGHPYEQAREIRKMIGLTRAQAQAVRNFRRMLEGSPKEMQQALSRMLRDKRFDSTIARAIKTGVALPKEKIDAMVDQYYRRYLDYRARNIARTESLRASNMGQRELWRQAQQQGYLPTARTRRVWLVARDERTCESCKEIPGMNPGGVRLNEPFKTPDGPSDGPPLHPSCRCDCALEFLPRI